MGWGSNRHIQETTRVWAGWANAGGQEGHGWRGGGAWALNAAGFGAGT